MPAQLWVIIFCEIYFSYLFMTLRWMSDIYIYMAQLFNYISFAYTVLSFKWLTETHTLSMVLKGETNLTIFI